MVDVLETMEVNGPPQNAEERDGAPRTGGRPQIPLWAKILCTLDVLERGLYFDDVAARADIGLETTRNSAIARV